MKIYRTLFTLCLLLFMVNARAQTTEIRYLSGTDKDHTVTWDFFCTKGMNSGKWATIEVPSTWEQQGYGAYNYGHDKNHNDEQGFYKHTFTVPEEWANKRIYIVFEGSMTDTEVKINGQLAGPVHQGAFYRFKYDISGLIRLKDENLLEVNVSKESSNQSINRAERISDYWIFGGIFRPVYLEAQPRTFVDRVAIDAKADGTFDMSVFVDNASEKHRVEARVQTLDKKDVGEWMYSEANANNGIYVLRGNIENPKSWNPEDPNRYQVLVRIREDGKTVHEMTQRFGFRTVEFKEGDGIYVNGTKLIFRGVCRHTFWPESGRTSSKALSMEVVNLMKDMNMNAVRMSHYPPDQHFLDACDELGLFVVDELAGWQKAYDTPSARRLVKETVVRDVNHPSIVLWANGNEGGFNSEVRSDYSLYDPQNRTVIEPWSKLNGTDTKHYPKYKYVENALNNGNLIYFPTEFLHGLFDGGHGAGLDDYWNLMVSKPLSAGGFLWVFADEGLERRDKNNLIDTQGNLAPDGILGPYHEKEGSFYTIKEIWAPVQFGETTLPADFDGTLNVTNRFLYSNLNTCRFTYKLVKMNQPFVPSDKDERDGQINAPDLPPGNKGSLKMDLPPDWKHFDVLYITAFDKFDRQINTWSWNISAPEQMAAKLISEKGDTLSVNETDDLLVLQTGKTTVTFNKANGLIAEVKNDSKTIAFANGPLFVGFEASFNTIKHYPVNDAYVVESVYDSAHRLKWTLGNNGWLQLDYEYRPSGSFDFSGITFSYPEDKVTGVTLVANGPYRVWKNRLKGTRFGIYEKTYNNTVTGESWEYPEFKGYYSNFYAMQLHTKELPITIVSGTKGLFLHLFTPQAAVHSSQNVNPPFPAGNISFLNGISPIGTKFSRADEEGPQGQKNKYEGMPLTGRLYFKFGE